MKVVLVHDYIKEYGGAERVLEALCEIFPEAPIYTAFYKKDSVAYQKFKNRKIIPSWVHYIPFFATKLHSPFRFLAPWIWGSFDFSNYDVVISSASWYVTKGFGSRNLLSHPELGSGSQTELDEERSRNKFGMTNSEVRNDDKKKRPIEICYCHTPPRWLYGYRTSIEWQKFWPIRIYGMIIGHFMRMYDFNAAQRVDYFIANSEEVKGRIKKFYRRDAVVINPPVNLNSKFEIRNSRLQTPCNGGQAKQIQNTNSQNLKKEIASPEEPDRNDEKGDYYFIVSRIVGGKGLDLAVEAAVKMGLKLKIAGAPAGYYAEYKRLIEKINKNSAVIPAKAGIHVSSGSPIRSGMTREGSGMTTGGNIEFLGFVTDEELANLYSGAKAFLALSKDEDFGITPVEAMLFGTPVIAYNGGGYKETVIDGKTGVFFNEHTVDSLTSAIKKFEKLSIKPEDCIRHARKFSKGEFERKIKEFVEKVKDN